MLYHIILCCIIPYYTVSCCVMLCSDIEGTILYCVILYYCIVPKCCDIVFYCIMLNYSIDHILHYVIHCITYSITYVNVDSVVDYTTYIDILHYTIIIFRTLHYMIIYCKILSDSLFYDTMLYYTRVIYFILPMLHIV